MQALVCFVHECMRYVHHNRPKDYLSLSQIHLSRFASYTELADGTIIEGSTSSFDEGGGMKVVRVTTDPLGQVTFV